MIRNEQLKSPNTIFTERVTLGWEERKGGDKKLPGTESPIINCVILATRGLQGPWALIWQELYISRRLILRLWSLQFKQTGATNSRENKQCPPFSIWGTRAQAGMEEPGIASSHLFFDSLWERSSSAATYTWKSHAGFLQAGGSLLEKSGANSCATSLVSWAVTLAGRVPSWTIFIKNWQTEYLWIRELRNAHYDLRKKNKTPKAKTKPPKPHNGLKTGELIAHENEVLVALSSLRHRKKFQSTALPTHTHASAGD